MEVTLDKRYDGMLDQLSFPEDASASIRLTEYQPNRMVYASESGTEQLAVFSEVFYEKGWQAYIDGDKADHLRVNYLLRGMTVPAGSHEIVFEFHPRSYYTGSTISTISSLLLLLLCAGAIYLQYQGKAKEKENLIEL
jgi:uncharacterized membrane protein YfhO